MEAAAERPSGPTRCDVEGGGHSTTLSVALADVQRVAADFKHSAGYIAAEEDA